MGSWRLHVVLLLPLFVLFSIEETIVKTVERETDVTQICSNETLNSITTIVCKISTERRREECHLIYRQAQDFLNECDSRFTLMQENKIMFLHLTNLTREDSGHYTCECIKREGKYTLHLNVTVKGEPTRSSKMPVLLAFTALTVTIIIGFIFSHWLKNHRLFSGIIQSSYTVTATPGLPAHETLDCLDEDDLYTNLQRPTEDLYQTITPVHHQHDIRTHTRSTERVCQEMDAIELIYENV